VGQFEIIVRAMPNPWTSIPFGRMNAPGVLQLAALAELFTRTLDYCRPESVAVLGVAGGNGLEQIDCTTTKKVVGVDINQEYIDEVQQSTSGNKASLFAR
jgi:hypothetical protein